MNETKRLYVFSTRLAHVIQGITICCRRKIVWLGRGFIVTSETGCIGCFMCQGKHIDGGGYIDREYAAGHGRMDLIVEYNNKMHIIEIKLIHFHDSPTEVREEGLEQITRYRDEN